MKRNFLIGFAAAMIFGATLFTAPAFAEDQPVTDTWITAKTKIALAADNRIKGTQVSVTTENGTVMLRGKVDSQEAKSAAEEVAKGLDGVKSVKNELQVVAPESREFVEERDDDITKAVKKQIKNDRTLKDADINVQTNAGIVSLTGKVPDLAASAEASWIARNVHGVKSVKNDLTLEKKS
jgi:hyperosmotically inducible protein